MNTKISSVDYLDRKLAEIFHMVSPQDDYIEDLHNKLKHRATIQIDSPNYYSLVKLILFFCLGLFLVVVMRKIIKILSR